MERARVIFVECPEHVECLGSLCFEPVALESHDMKRHKGRFGFRDPINETQWPWAKDLIRQHPGYALQWVAHSPASMTPEQVVATTDWTPDTVTVLDYSGHRKPQLVQP